MPTLAYCEIRIVRFSLSEFIVTISFPAENRNIGNVVAIDVPNC